ncbi:MAG: hypothetical protein QOK29_694 [Rhodospirillaceae bacterium]|jgi:hypothetical protein|nr:hypothetical protein [Rhodospirillaceae bacterium]
MTMSSSTRARSSVLPLPSLDLDKLSPLSSVTQLLRSQAKLAATYSNEMSRFAAQRLRRDEQFLAEMTSCRDWGSVALLQTRWATETFTDYLQESSRLAELLQNLPSEMLAPERPAEMKAAA